MGISEDFCLVGEPKISVDEPLSIVVNVNDEGKGVTFQKDENETKNNSHYNNTFFII